MTKTLKWCLLRLCVVHHCEYRSVALLELKTRRNLALTWHDWQLVNYGEAVRLLWLLFGISRTQVSLLGFPLAAAVCIKLYFLPVVSVCVTYPFASSRAGMDRLSDSGFANAVCATVRGKWCPSKQRSTKFLSLASFGCDCKEKSQTSLLLCSWMSKKMKKQTVS